MRGILREIQLEGLEEVKFGNHLEGEMAEDSIPQALWKEMKDAGKQRNGQILQVREEGGVMLLSPPLQDRVNS